MMDVEAREEGAWSLSMSEAKRVAVHMSGSKLGYFSDVIIHVVSNYDECDNKHIQLSLSTSEYYTTDCAYAKCQVLQDTIQSEGCIDLWYAL